MLCRQVLLNWRPDAPARSARIAVPWWIRGQHVECQGTVRRLSAAYARPTFGRRPIPEIDDLVASHSRTTYGSEGGQPIGRTDGGRAFLR